MKQSYKDIIDKLGAPIFWDEVGCPRYEKFHPSLSSNIYAQEVALVLIGCQSCRFKFKVCFSSIGYRVINNTYMEESLSKHIIDKTIHYGDPPNYCCHSGATMNSEPINVIEFWRRDNFKWKRDKKLEISLE